MYTNTRYGYVVMAGLKVVNESDPGLGKVRVNEGESG